MRNSIRRGNLCTFCDGSGYVEETDDLGRCVTIQCMECAKATARKERAMAKTTRENKEVQDRRA